MSISAVLVAAVLGALIPPLNALLVKVSANPVLKSLVAVVLAGVGAVVAYASNATGDISYKQLIGVGVAALVAAGGLRVTAFVSDIEKWIVDHTGSVGLGRERQDHIH